MEKINAVFYGDGSYKKEDGNRSGFGIHGYLYEPLGVERTPSLKDWSATPKGYFKKEGKTINPEVKAKVFEKYPEIRSDPKTDDVKILKYIDIYGPISKPFTNNRAELTALINIFKFCLEYSEKEGKEFDDITIRLDSKYVIDNLTHFLKRWKENNWVKRDGDVVKNRDLWMRVDEGYEKLKRIANIELIWIEGHKGEPGNEKADRNANRGGIRHKIITETNGEVVEEVTHCGSSPVEKYWSNDSYSHPMVHYKNWYFNLYNEKPLEVTVDGITHHTYHFGNHGNEYTFIGKPLPDTSYSVAFLKEPIELLEIVRKRQRELPASNCDNVVTASIDTVFSRHNHKPILNEGALLYKGEHLNDLYNPMGDQLTKELQPPRIAFNLVEVFNSLHSTLLKFVKGDLAETQMVELTDKFYVEEKKTKLKKEIDSVVKSLDFDLNYSVIKGTGTKKVTLTLGQDLPTRNYLAKLESHSPRVYGLTLPESDHAFRYFTIIKCDLGVAIYAGFYSNIILID